MYGKGVVIEEESDGEREDGEERENAKRIFSDPSKALEEELKSLKDSDSSSFRCLQGEGRGILLFESLSSSFDVVSISRSIFRDWRERKRSVRLLFTLIPFQTVCRAKVDDLRRSVEVLLSLRSPQLLRHSKETLMRPFRFEIRMRSHLSAALSRRDVVDAIRDVIHPIHVADFCSPEVIIVVEMLKGFCLLCVVTDPKDFGDFRFHEKEAVEGKKEEEKTEGKKEGDGMGEK